MIYDSDWFDVKGWNWEFYSKILDVMWASFVWYKFQDDFFKTIFMSSLISMISWSIVSWRDDVDNDSTTYTALAWHVASVAIAFFKMQTSYQVDYPTEVNDQDTEIVDAQL